MHCSRRRLLRRGLEFHVCTINKSAYTKKCLEICLMILVPLVRTVKFKLCTVPVDHLAYPVMSSLILSWREFTSFAYYMINRIIYISSFVVFGLLLYYYYYYYHHYYYYYYYLLLYGFSHQC